MFKKLKDFKNKKCKTIFGTILQFILFHHLTQIGIVVITLLTSGIIVGNGAEGSPLWNFAYNTMWVCSGILVLIILIGIFFAWIINPIRDKKNNKNGK